MIPAPNNLPENIYDPTDHDTVRDLIFSGISSAVENIPEASYGKYRIGVSDVKYPTKMHISKAEHKGAILSQSSAEIPLKGRLNLFDNETNELVDTKKVTLARVPYLSPHGTFVRNGSEYAVGYQKQLRAGAYTRQTAQGEYETFVTTKAGSGFNIVLDPEKGRLQFKIYKSSTPLYSVMRAMGSTDEELKKLWGPELFKMNKIDDWQKPLPKLWKKITRGREPEPENLSEHLKDVFSKMHLDAETTTKTLGAAYETVTPELMGVLSNRLLQSYRGEKGADNRDSFSFQRVRGKEDLFADAIVNDQYRTLQTLLHKAQTTGNLKHATSNVFKKPIDHVFYKSRMGSAVEEINPMDALDTGLKLSGMGDGGFPSPDAVPGSARLVQDTQFGLVDPIRTSESGAVGVDSRLAYNTFKGTDGQLYGKFRTPSGKVKYLPGSQLDEYNIAFPGELERVAAGKSKVVRAMAHGKMSFVNPEDVDYTLGSGQDMFSLNANLVPFLSGVKGMRLLMGSKYSVSGDTTVVIRRRATNEIWAGPISEYVWAEGDFSPSLSAGKTVWKEVHAVSQHEHNLSMYKVRLVNGDHVDVTEHHSLVEMPNSSTGELREITPRGIQKALAVSRPVRIPVAENLRIEGHTDTVRGFKLTPEAAWYLGQAYSTAKYALITGVTNVKIRVRNAVQHPGSPGTGPEAVIEGYKRAFGVTAALSKTDRWSNAFLRIDNADDNTKAFGKLITAGDISNDILSLYHNLQIEFMRGVIAGCANASSIHGRALVRCQLYDRTAPTVSKLARFLGLGGHLHVTHVGLDNGHRDWPRLTMRQGLTQLFPTGNSKVDTYVQKNEVNMVETQKNYSRVRSVKLTKCTGSVYDLHMDDNVFLVNNGMFVHNTNQSVALTADESSLSGSSPISEREEPLVQSLRSEGGTFHKYAAKFAGAEFTQVPGVVKKVTKDEIIIEGLDGELHKHELYNEYPLNRKSLLTNTPAVAVGDVVKAGGLLADSNYTKNGVLALGRNLRVGYIADRGRTFEDGITISESAADKLVSEQMYTETLEKGKNVSTDIGKFRSLFPSEYTKDQLAKLGDSGVIKKGQVLQEGDPMVINLQRSTHKGIGQLTRSKEQWKNSTITWDHKHAGVVTDVWDDKGDIKVAVKTKARAEVGDKLALAYGNKGVISVIRPNHDMPHDSEGNPLEMLINPYGIISRHNPAQVVEALLGKIALKTGKPYAMPAFMEGNVLDFVEEELKKHGLSAEEAMFDGEDGRKLGNDQLTGSAYVYKLHHLAESKASGVGATSYSMSGTPTSGVGGDNPKRMGMLEMDAMIAHGVPNVIKDVRLNRGQANSDVWRAVMDGKKLPNAPLPLMYKRLLATLKSSGIDVQSTGPSGAMQLSVMTDNEVLKVSSGKLGNSETVKWKSTYGRNIRGDEDLNPVSGGLFDRALTGGMGGSKFSHIELATKLPQPAFEKPIRVLLGITEKKLHGIISSKDELEGFGTGPKALEKALAAINVDDELSKAKALYKTSSRPTVKDVAAKRIRVLQGLNEQKMKPSDYLVKNVLVIPPVFRPISLNDNFEIVADANLLYKDLVDSDTSYRKLVGTTGADVHGESLLNTYKGLKAVVGLGDPVKRERKEKHVKGLLKDVFGPSGTKSSIIQKYLLGTPTSYSARGVIVPDPDLNMDQIGIPEEQLWELFKPFVVRRMIKNSDGSPEAKRAVLKAVETRSGNARKSLEAELDDRPVLYSRAPVLHKYGIIAGYAKMVPGNAIHTNAMTTSGLNADYDGDTFQLHTLVSDEAVAEAKEKMLPSRMLRSPSNFELAHMPMQDFRMGLTLAAEAKGGKSRTERSFKSKEEVFAAYKRGEINLNDDIVIEDKAD